MKIELHNCISGESMNFSRWIWLGVGWGLGVRVGEDGKLGTTGRVLVCGSAGVGGGGARGQ